MGKKAEPMDAWDQGYAFGRLNAIQDVNNLIFLSALPEGEKADTNLVLRTLAIKVNQLLLEE